MDIASAAMPIGLLIPLIDVIPFHFARLPVCLSPSIYIYEQHLLSLLIFCNFFDQFHTSPENNKNKAIRNYT